MKDGLLSPKQRPLYLLRQTNTVQGRRSYKPLFRRLGVPLYSYLKNTCDKEVIPPLFITLQYICHSKLNGVIYLFGKRELHSCLKVCKLHRNFYTHRKTNIHGILTYINNSITIKLKKDSTFRISIIHFFSCIIKPGHRCF